VSPSLVSCLSAVLTTNEQTNIKEKNTKRKTEKNVVKIVIVKQTADYRPGVKCRLKATNLSRLYRVIFT